MGIFKDGWDGFIAKEATKGDGSQSCEAEIQATNNTTNVTVTYYGNTKNLHGHAEIDGLYQFMKAIGWNAAVWTQYTVTVTCEAKPCCKYCSAVLGNLGVFATDGTYKSTKSMGVSYALPPDMRAFLSRFLGVTESTITSELCG
ncbi:MAG: hypothetical protein ACYC0F_00480 [Rhodanobacter sp.]